MSGLMVKSYNIGTTFVGKTSRSGRKRKMKLDYERKEVILTFRAAWIKRAAAGD